MAGSLLAAVPGVAIAQDSDDQINRLETVSVAGLRPVRDDYITTSVSKIDAAELAIRNTPYIADQLRLVPGVAVSRSGSLGGLTQVRIRGAEANHTLVLLNGIEISDPVTGETDFGLISGLPVSGIEVLRGEQSSLYGSDAIGGVINLRTGDSEGFRAEAEIGTENTVRGTASGAFGTETSSLVAALSGYSTSGVDSSGRGGETDGSDSYSGLVTGETNIEGFGQLTGLLTYRSSTSQTDPDLDFDGQLDNADRETESYQWLVGGTWSAEGFGFDHLVSASFNQVERENFADDSSTDSTTGERLKLSYSPARVFEIPGGNLSVAGLIDWEQEDYERVGVASFYGDPNQSQTFQAFGTALDARANLERVTVSASVRHDDNDGRFEDATTWRLGGAFRATQTTRLRASLGEGVKNPTFTELFGFYPGSFIGNPDLNPEKSASWEIGIDQDFGPVSASLTYFEADLEDEIYTAYTPTFASTPANRMADSNRSGIEMSALWPVSEAVTVSGSLTNTDSSSNDGSPEIRVPEWTGSLSLNWQSTVNEGYRAGVALDYVGEQLDTDFGTFTTVTLDEYVLVSATAEFPVNDTLSFTLRGNNLLDETVTDVFGYYGPGAAVFVGLKLR
ncbi:MAG: TonB-dependent receptor [Ponticaulis sp.]|nr:TonB-dependent receptor [Ponticaulis sp.]